MPVENMGRQREAERLLRNALRARREIRLAALTGDLLQHRHDVVERLLHGCFIAVQAIVADGIR